jgi:hypothetical protein
MKLHLASAFLFVGVASTFAAAPFPARTVAVTNAPAPGLGPGASFSSLFAIDLNNKGETAFHATLSGAGVNPSNNTSFWSEGDGSLKIVAREGDQAPGRPSGEVFGEFLLYPFLSETGRTVFPASLLNGPGDFDEGVWAYDEGALSVVASTGEQAPGAPSGFQFAAFLSNDRLPAISDNGQVMVEPFLTGPGGGVRGLWLQTSGPPALVMLSGMQAPGFAPGVTINGPGGFKDAPSVNNSGDTAFEATLSGPGITSETRVTVWKTEGGSLQLVMQSGDPAPGAPAGASFTGFIPYPSVLFNNAGQVAFHAYTGDSGGQTGEGIWSEGGGILHAVAHSGQPAPGAPGHVFAGFLSPLLNDNGQTAFTGYLDDGKQGIWSEGTGALELVATIGGPAPQFDAGATFTSMGGHLNDRGQLFLEGNVAEPGMGSNSSGIWVHNPDGRLGLLVRVGDSLEVAPGDVRSITGLNFIDVNDVGQFVFTATFPDGSRGLFVSGIIPVPEPTALVLSVIPLVAALRARAPKPSEKPASLTWLVA